MPERDVGARRERPRTFLLPLLSLAVYLLLCAFLLLGILYVNDGHFTFSLDDPYIHLALSEQIAKGHYGINPGEAASPSSSVIWPFLLVPFARLPWQPFAALALNVLAGAGSALLLGLAVVRWPGWNRSLDERLRRLLSAAFLVVIANLAGLTFIGMEHSLQVLLAIGCAWGVVSCLQGRSIPVWCLLAAAIGPSVRYENVGLSVAVALALWGQRKRRQAGLLVGVSVLPLLVFSAYLHHLHLPLLPTSVLMKAGAMGSERGVLPRIPAVVTDHSVFGRNKALAELAFSVQQFSSTLPKLFSENRDLLLVLAATLAGLAVYEKERVRRYALGGAAVAAGLHLAIGRFGWFYRYEVYVVIFSVLVILHVLHERPRMLLGWYVLGLMTCAAVYAAAIRDTVASAQEVYLQQYQMHRFASDYYKGNVAVNDLGRVSYRRPSTEGVLDIAGLGSVEAARQKDKSAAWLDAVTREHHTGVVMLYRSWYPELPATWRQLGQLCLLRKPVAAGDRCVEFYATGLDPVQDIQDDFDDFVKTLPPGVQWIPRPPR